MASSRWTLAFATLVLMSSGVSRASADGELPPWPGYGSELELVETTGWEAVYGASGTTSSSAAQGRDAATGAYVYVRSHVRAGPERSDGESEVCWFEISEPIGAWDGRTLNAEVRAQVFCNFRAKTVNYSVQFRGSDAATGPSFIRTGNNVVCTWTTRCGNAYATYSVTGNCSGRFDHYGVAYGSYWNSDDKEFDIEVNGLDGPHKTGYSYSNYC